MIPAILHRWYMSQVGVGGALMLTVEFVLMARGQSYLLQDTGYDVNTVGYQSMLYTKSVF
jgi:hypothetical protein